MNFPNATQLALPCHFERIIEGELHADGRRYLPLLVFSLPQATPASVVRLGVVDRHHRVDQAMVGRHGAIRLVFLLSALHVLETPRTGVFDPKKKQAHTTETSDGSSSMLQQISTMPEAYGKVLAVPTWETDAGHLPYETLYTELLLDIGIGVVGVRTSTTAISLNNQIGKQQIEPGDWVSVTRSRIDILGFTPDD